LKSSGIHFLEPCPFFLQLCESFGAGIVCESFSGFFTGFVPLFEEMIKNETTTTDGLIDENDLFFRGIDSKLESFMQGDITSSWLKLEQMF
jgi:hypothetical protein